jgi:hypothetical protein
MRAPRFQSQGSPGTTHRLTMSSRRPCNWVLLPKSAAQTISNLLTNEQGSDRRRLFAIVGRPGPSAGSEKQTRRIVVFDNHPATLRLLAKKNRTSDLPLNLSKAGQPLYLVAAVALLLVFLAAVFWPVISAVKAHSKEGIVSNSSVAVQNPADAQWQQATARRILGL